MTKKMMLIKHFWHHSFIDTKIIFQDSLKGSEIVFDYFHLLYYKCHKINSDHGRSYIHSPDWIKNKKATINPINKKDNKCFQYTLTVALNHEEIGKQSERITKVKTFINK